jgi:hypothetical protein
MGPVQDRKTVSRSACAKEALIYSIENAPTALAYSVLLEVVPKLKFWNNNLRFNRKNGL